MYAPAKSVTCEEITRGPQGLRHLFCAPKRASGPAQRTACCLEDGAGIEPGDDRLCRPTPYHLATRPSVHVRTKNSSPGPGESLDCFAREWDVVGSRPSRSSTHLISRATAVITDVQKIREKEIVAVQVIKSVMIAPLQKLSLHYVYQLSRDGVKRSCA